MVQLASVTGCSSLWRLTTKFMLLAPSCRRPVLWASRMAEISRSVAGDLRRRCDLLTCSSSPSAPLSEFIPNWAVLLTTFIRRSCSVGPAASACESDVISVADAWRLTDELSTSMHRRNNSIRSTLNGFSCPRMFVSRLGTLVVWERPPRRYSIVQVQYVLYPPIWGSIQYVLYPPIQYVLYPPIWGSSSFIYFSKSIDSYKHYATTLRIRLKSN